MSDVSATGTQTNNTNIAMQRCARGDKLFVPQENAGRQEVKAQARGGARRDEGRFGGSRRGKQPRSTNRWMGRSNSIGPSTLSLVCQLPGKYVQTDSTYTLDAVHRELVWSPGRNKRRNVGRGQPRFQRYTAVAFYKNGIFTPPRLLVGEDFVTKTCEPICQACLSALERVVVMCPARGRGPYIAELVLVRNRRCC